MSPKRCHAKACRHQAVTARFAARLFFSRPYPGLVVTEAHNDFPFYGSLRAGLFNSEQIGSSFEEMDARGVFSGPCDTVSPTPRVEEPSRHGDKFVLDKRDVSSPPFGRHGCCRAKGAEARRTFVCSCSGSVGRRAGSVISSVLPTTMGSQETRRGRSHRLTRQSRTKFFPGLPRGCSQSCRASRHS